MKPKSNTCQNPQPFKSIRQRPSQFLFDSYLKGGQALPGEEPPSTWWVTILSLALSKPPLHWFCTQSILPPLPILYGPGGLHHLCNAAGGLGGPYGTIILDTAAADADATTKVRW
jgi:hypothetical protein